MGRHHYDVVHAVDHKPNTYFCGYAGRRHPSLFVNDWLDLWGGDGGINKMYFSASFRSHLSTRRKVGSGIQTESRWCRHNQLVSSTTRPRAGLRSATRYLFAKWLRHPRLPFFECCPSTQQAGHSNRTKDHRLFGYGHQPLNEMQMLMRTLVALPDVKLMVIGPPKSTWGDLATEHGVADRMWQTGYVADSDVHTHLCSADILCTPLADTPASHARLAGKLMSYMIAGRPSVVTPVGETARVIQQNNIGLVAEPASYARAVQMLFDMPDLATDLGNNARRCAETTFSNLGLSKSLMAFYQRIKKTHHRPMNRRPTNTSKR